MYKHTFDPNILRSYDIRGIFEKTLNSNDAWMLGYFFGLTIKQDNPLKLHPLIVVGMDGRLSSPILEKSLNDGLKKSGCEVYRIGMGPTPMLYFSSQYFNADGAIQVTGSHNPKDHNGFKIVANQKSFFGKDIIKLGKFAQEGSDNIHSGSSKKVTINEEYIKKIIDPLKKHNKLLSNKTIVWDCGNGAVGPSINAITKQLLGNHIVLFSEVDGNFPNHHPDPTDPSTLKLLSSKMLEVNADLGIGFDGDGDRLGIIDKQGRPVPGDLLTAFLSNAIVKNKDKTIILDIKSSQVAYNKIIENGFKVEIWKTGHSHIKKRMKEINSPLAGEMSGHIFFAEDYYGYDDALYASIKLLELVTKNHNLEDFISALPITFPSPEIKVTCSDNIKFNIVEKILKQTLVDYSSNDVIELDGVRVNNKCGWWLIRASNTEAVLVIRVEGTSEENKKKLLIEVQKRLKNVGLTWELP